MFITFSQWMLSQQKRSLIFSAAGWPRTRMAISHANWSCPAGTGVWVVKAHIPRTFSTSASLKVALV